MSDYSEYILTEMPPTPSPSFWDRAESWFHPLQFATEGKGMTFEGRVRTKRFWELRRGRLMVRGIDHVVHTEPWQRNR